MPKLVSTVMFRNARVTSPNPDPALVLPGDSFKTDKQHALDLKTAGLAVDAPSGAEFVQEVEGVQAEAPRDVVAAAEAEISTPRRRRV